MIVLNLAMRCRPFPRRHGRMKGVASAILSASVLSLAPVTALAVPDPTLIGRVVHSQPIVLNAGQTEEWLPIHQIPNLGRAAEFYFSPDSTRLIGNAKREGDEYYQVYVLNIDGTGIVKVNDRGKDACAFFLPGGKRIVWTSTKDHPDVPPGDWSVSWDYPQGAELYTSNLDGSEVHRVTNNLYYDAEVTVRGDGEYLVFGRQVNGKMDLWRSRVDGTGEKQITNFEGWEPGGVQYVHGTNKLLFRAWKTADQVRKQQEPTARWPTPMELFTINDDGTDLVQLTNDGGTNWAPFPAPDGKHYVFAKILDGRNYEIFLGDYESTNQRRLTFNDAFDGMPSISPDGKWLAISSSRDSPPGERFITQYLIDITSLDIGPKAEVKAANY